MPNPLGIMIARGDLAVECGWENMAYIQKEIISVCAAAHVPVIWATQVLESLVRSGVPTRAELTDVAEGMRSVISFPVCVCVYICGGGGDFDFYLSFRGFRN